MRAKRNSLFYLIFGVWILAFGNTGLAQNPDTIVFSYDDFIAIVKQNHPLAINADLKLSEGEAKVLYAKGAFDPKLITDFAQKQYHDKQYYNKLNAGLKIPTWFGIEVQGGFENNYGDYLNPERTTPSAGLIYGGVSVTLGKGLFIDQRRAELKKAKLYQQITEAERTLLMNELLYDASLAYWKWFEDYHKMVVYKDAYQLALQRLEGVKEMAAIGERPSIDTVEASIQVQNRTLLWQQSELNFLNSSALLSVYLWNEGVIPLELTAHHIPVGMDAVTQNSASNLLLAQKDSLVQNHPALQKAEFKIGQLELDQRWQREQLKPELNIKYNPVFEPVGGQPFSDFSFENYVVGVNFSMPLFIRKERGNLRMMNIKLQQSQLHLAQKRANINYKVTAAINQWATTEKQTQLYAQTVKSYAELLAAERNMFDTGESSLFMINSREMGYVKAQIKFVELLSKNRQAEIKVKYSLAKML